MKTHVPFLMTAVIGLAGCQSVPPPCDGSEAFEPGVKVACGLDDWDGRGYDVYPVQTRAPAPLIVVLHGGGGNREGALGVTCPDGNFDAPSCLHRIANDAGYIVVAPDGTSSKFAKRVRTWNAGGGEGEWQCMGGRACRDGVDDIAFIRDLLDDLGHRVSFDPARVFVTGMSNGGAMAHRVGCELADRVTAIAPVAGANQFETIRDCSPDKPVGVLHIHGTADPCWAYEGGDVACSDNDGKLRQSVPATMDGWAARNGCADPSIAPMPDAAADGLTTERRQWNQCTAPVELLEIRGGGHTWPGGRTAERILGPVTTDFGSEVIVEFFDQFGGQTNE